MCWLLLAVPQIINNSLFYFILLIGPCILEIISKGLSDGFVPDYLKHTIVKPLLKKSNLDLTVLSNFRPISNLPFISKILEKIVSVQLLHFLDSN